MRVPRLPWKKDRHARADTADVVIAGLWLYAMVIPFGDTGRWRWRISVCGFTATDETTSRASAMRHVRDRLERLRQFLNAWRSP